MNNLKYKEMERIIIDKNNVDSIEEDIIIRRGIERYMYARQFVYGDVLDIACGIGYGSYLMSKNPDVHNIIAVDKNENTIKIANENFRSDKIKFILGQPEYITDIFDVLVCLETIEHLSDPTVLKNMVNRCGIKEIIISFPNKKTTHYNKYHIWDMNKEAVLELFDNFELYKTNYLHDSSIMNLIKIERNRTKVNRYRL